MELYEIESLNLQLFLSCLVVKRQLCFIYSARVLQGYKKLMAL